MLRDFSPLPLACGLGLLVLLGGCSTPANIQEKSEAALGLQRDVLAAQKTLATAYVGFILEEDRRAREVAELGAESPGLRFEGDPPISAGLRSVIESQKRLRTLLEILGLVQGTVDRYLRIDVLDLDEISTLIDSLDSASQDFLEATQ